MNVAIRIIYELSTLVFITGMIFGVVINETNIIIQSGFLLLYTTLIKKDIT
jgi:hypothetical protein